VFKAIWRRRSRNSRTRNSCSSL